MSSHRTRVKSVAFYYEIPLLSSSSSSSSAAAAAAAATGDRWSWANLPFIVLLLILDNLFSIADLSSFSAVCREWRSAAKSAILSRSFVPLLLRPDPALPSSLLLLLDPAASPARRSFQSPIRRKTLALPFLGYSQGRLLFSGESLVTLADPFSGASRCLPNPPSGPLRGCVALSAPLSSPNCFLLNLDRDQHFLLFCNPRTRRWARQNFPPAADVSLIMSFSGKTYGLTNDCGLVGLEYSKCDSEFSWYDLSMQFEGGDRDSAHQHALYSHCLVRSGEDVLMVLFTIQSETFVRIKVYRMNLGRIMWVRVDKLEDSCLFVDPFMRVGMACEKPERWGGRSNCLYVVGNEEGDPWVALPLDGRLIPTQGRESPLSLDYMGTMQGFTPLWVYPSLLL